MKPTALSILLLLLLPAYLPAAPRHLQAACEDKPDFPGLLGRGQALPAANPGTAVELLRLLAVQMQFRFTLQRYPWRRALEMTASGESDLLIYASWNPQRASRFRFPLRNGQLDIRRRFATRTYTLYRLRGDRLRWHNNRMENLKGTIGAPRGYSIVPFLQQAGIPVDVSDATGQDLRKLLHGRVQGVVALQSTAEMYLQQHPEWRTKLEAAGTVRQQAYYFVFSNRFYTAHTAFAERFWDTLALLRNSPAYRRIQTRYRL